MNQWPIVLGALAAALGTACSEEEPAADEPTDAVSLYGADVRLSAHCCDAPATEANLISQVLTRSVGDGVEFPAIEASATTQPVIAADVDVTATTISIAYRDAIVAEVGSFNGYLFQIDSANPIIMDAALDAATSTPADSVTLSFTEQSVSVNVAGISVDEGARIVIALQLEEVSDAN